MSSFQPALSPLGDRLAYVSQGPAGIRTFVRRSDEFTSREISVGSSQSYAFSPDGRWLMHDAGSVVKKVSSDGGAGITIATIPTTVIGLAWRSPSEIVVGSSRGLWLVPAAGGAPRRVPSVDTTVFAAWPTMVDDGETVVFMLGGADRSVSQMAVVSLSSGRPVTLGVMGAVPRGMLDGHLIYMGLDGALMAVPFDVRGKKLSGEPIQLMDRVVGVAVSASGTLAYVPGQSNAHLVMIGGGGAEIPVMHEARRYVAPRFSPDGRKIAVAVGMPTSPANHGDIWVYDIAARTFTQVSTDGPVNAVPEWSPDGTRVLYRRNEGAGRRSAWWRVVDGSGPAERLSRIDESINEALISPDGKWFVYRTSPSGAYPRDIFAVPMTGERRPILSLARGAGVRHDAATFPRRTMARVYVRRERPSRGRRPAIPESGARIQVTTDGGGEPLWARSGKALVYRTGQSVMSVAVSTSPTFTIGERRTLATGYYLTEPSHQNYDISPDGSRLLMVRGTEASGNAVIVHNWRREFREKFAADRK